ncbi:hypothetical protein FC682_17910 [Peribacillus simplex]|uniref:hypothetical protein n=1 Tax=Peribacillus simplex TaxID=1478 RepID=UPI0010BECC66|nr:hypothetical protein [Peribacillus simplex]TKH03441.1 hypothetical protein FC682_17910 [Peribacillus simplex]
MDQWVLYGKSGNPSSDITKAWFKNNGIPVEENSLFQLTKKEIEKLASLLPGGVKSMVYPDAFSYCLINPQRKTESIYIDKIHGGYLSEEEIANLLVNYPLLIMTPIVTDYKSVIIGYDLNKLNSTLKYVKVKNVSG